MRDRDPGVAPHDRGGQEGRAVRLTSRDGEGSSVTNGASLGADGEPTELLVRLRPADRRDLVVGWIVIGAVAAAVVIVNAFTELRDNPDAATWEPWVWEISSAVVVMFLLWLPWLTSSAAPPPDVWRQGLRLAARFAVVHLAGATAYTALHITGFVVLRSWAYELMGAGPYDFGALWSGFLYEFRKDLLSYSALVVGFWLIGRWRKGVEGALRPVSFDIRDSGRIIRAPLGDILAVSSAGNYVEVWLADGRKPLMRATLAAIEAELGGFGFVRTHRSWLVNEARITGLVPDGSGDWTAALGDVTAPISRRYPEALERLKSPLTLVPGPR